MKRILSILTLLLSLTFSFTSCKKDNLRIANDCPLCGTWKLDSVREIQGASDQTYTYSGYNAEYKFDKDSLICSTNTNIVNYYGLIGRFGYSLNDSILSGTPNDYIVKIDEKLVMKYQTVTKTTLQYLTKK